MGNPRGVSSHSCFSKGVWRCLRKTWCEGTRPPAVSALRAPAVLFLSGSERRVLDEKPNPGGKRNEMMTLEQFRNAVAKAFESAIGNCMSRFPTRQYQEPDYTAGLSLGMPSFENQELNKLGIEIAG